MEKLQSLEASLPAEQPPTQQTIDHLQEEISNEFKKSANSVAKLYRLSNEKNSLLKHKGYLDCIGDLMNFIRSNDNVNKHDIELWCLKQKNDLLGMNNDDKFNFNKKLKKDKEYILSMPPLSVEHNKNLTSHTPAMTTATATSSETATATVLESTDHKYKKPKI